MTEKAKWITNGTKTPFYVRKKFILRKPVKTASAKVCGLGQFHFYINGRKVSDHELDPGWTDYRKYIQYVTFDVTGCLHDGENMLGAEVGNGWFIKTDEHYTFTFPEFMPPNPNPYQPYGESLIFMAELVICYEDGTSEIIASDETFETRKHPVVMSNVYGSETIDGRLVAAKWCTPESAGSGWEYARPVPEDACPEGRLEEQFQPPVRVIRTYMAEYLHQAGGRDIYDFGQNMSGILEFEAMGKAGDMIKIYPAEKLGADKDVDQKAKNWTVVDSCITYIIGQDDAWEKCRMKFTYFAGRYVAIEKICISQTEPHEEPILRNFRADAITSAYQTDGSFSCDDKRYNQIYDMIEKTVEANMLSVHTDCPTIERFAWQEPNHLMTPSIMYMKDGRKLWEKFLLDMRVQQHTKEDYFLDYDGNRLYPGDGLMPSQCPCYIPNVIPVPGMGSFYDIIAWGSTCILGTYWHYQFYGDQKIIRDNYDAGMRYLRHLQSKVTPEGFINHGLGDWGNPRNELARENIETAFLYADTKVLAMFAEILDNPRDRRELEAWAEEIRANYNSRLLVQHPEKGFWCYRCADHPDEIFLTQASQALPLFWGMAPEDKKEDITRALAYTLERDGALICGEVGLPYVIQSAAQAGLNSLISRFILKEEHPSYYAFILDGETTLGEYWEKNPRSHCHDMMGHIIEWYYNGIAGIIPDKPGFKEVTIRPYLPESIHEFTCSYRSVSGHIRLHIKEEKEEILLETDCGEDILVHIDTSNLMARKKPVKCFTADRRL
ncbi:MAG: glycoside hydrolase family 78 protein [Lachnospiraceae bacterium]|nr:glycoside hydrolase family 78 protein [Lachnospiraceae bacterium]